MNEWNDPIPSHEKFRKELFIDGWNQMGWYITWTVLAGVALALLTKDGTIRLLFMGMALGPISAVAIRTIHYRYLSRKHD